MAKTEQEIIIDAPIDRVFDVIVDFERYPEFLPDMKRTQILSLNDGVSLVSFELEIIMRLGYTLRLVADRPNSLVWTLEKAKMMSENCGDWHLEKVGEKQTRARYGLEIKLKGLIPKSVNTRLVDTTLPETLRRFKERAESL